MAQPYPHDDTWDEPDYDAEEAAIEAAAELLYEIRKDEKNNHIQLQKTTTHS